eukprot:jgi/Mesvir1/6925/Mv09078-RA.1
MGAHLRTFLKASRLVRLDPQAHMQLSAFRKLFFHDFLELKTSCSRKVTNEELGDLLRPYGVSIPNKRVRGRNGERVAIVAGSRPKRRKNDPRWCEKTWPTAAVRRTGPELPTPPITPLVLGQLPPVIAPPPAPMGSGTGVGALAAILRIVYAEDTNKVFRATV